jgi:hypothetical protein
MSFEEKGTWAVTVIAVAVAVFYFATILGLLPTTAVGEIDYQVPLLTAIGATIGLSIVASIAIAILSSILSHEDASKSDVRDRDINRLGEYVGGIVVTTGMLLPFGLAMAEAQHFWIANAMYLIFVLSGLSAAVVKLVIYRRGF